MLLATYQSGSYKSIEDMITSERFESKDLGFNPVWCMPVTSPADLFAESLLCSPNGSDMFFIIDTDEYYRVDKLENYRQMHRGEGKRIKDLIVPEGALPDRHCEFIVSSEQLRKPVLVCAAVQDYRKFQIQGLGEGQMDKLYGPIWEASRDIILHPVRKMSVSIPNNTVLSGMSVNDLILSKSYALHYKMAFEVALIVFLTHLVMDGQANAALLYAVSRDFVAYSKLQENFYFWHDTDGSADGYDYIYERARGMVLDDPDVVTVLHDYKKPGRNDPCPCGSGKKFKKCHGTAGYVADPVWCSGVYLDRLPGY